MRIILAIIALFSLTQIGICQEKSIYTLKWGVNADYSFSGSTNSIVLGPSLYMGKGLNGEREFMHAFNLNAGFTWSKHTYSSAVSSVGYYSGKVPGVVFGISSQQYFNMESRYNITGTDVRLSGEVIFALFGFLGYRYQYPMLRNNEAQEVTRHSFIFRIPIPIKTISRNKKSQ